MPPFPWDISNLGEFLKNDLEKGVIEKYPILRLIKQRLLDVGAAGSLMSGSGSAIYGLFLLREQAEQAYHKLRRDFKGEQWKVFLTRSIGY